MAISPLYIHLNFITPKEVMAFSLAIIICSKLEYRTIRFLMLKFGKKNSKRL